MGFDWEATLGETSYEEAVEIAEKSLERLKEQEMELENTDMLYESTEKPDQKITKESAGKHTLVIDEDDMIFN